MICLKGYIQIICAKEDMTLHIMYFDYFMTKNIENCYTRGEWVLPSKYTILYKIHIYIYIKLKTITRLFFYLLSSNGI